MPANAPWTSETARAASLRSWELRPLRRGHFLPKTMPSLAGLSPGSAPASESTSKRLARTLHQIDHLDKLLRAPGLSPKDWDLLTRAKERLFKAWVHLAGIPSPGQLRPQLRPGSQAAPKDPEPMTIDISPSPPALPPSTEEPAGQ